MNIRVTRLLCLLLALIMIVALFPGCGQKEGTSNVSDSTGTPQQSGSSGDSEETVTITVATWVNNRNADGEYVDELVAKAFMEKYPNIKVNWELLTENDANSYMTKVDLALAGGESFDVISFPTRADYADRIRRGMLAQLDEFFEAEGKKVTDIYYIDPTIDGKVYGVPWDVKYSFVMLNKQMLDEAGLPVPEPGWTWEDFRQYAKALTKGEGANKIYGSYFWFVPSYNYFGISNAMGQDPFLTMDGKSNMLHPDLKEWIHFVYNDMERTDGSLYPYIDAKTSNISYRDLFFQGKIGMLPIGTWMIQEVGSNVDKYPREWVTAFAPVPKWKDYPAGNTTENTGYTCINVHSKNKEAAYKYIRFHSSEGVYIRATGLPPVHGYDVDRIMETMMGGREDLYDVESLKTTLENTTVHTITNVFSYSKKVTDAVHAATEKYIVGGVSIDEAFAEADAAVKEIIETTE